MAERGGHGGLEDLLELQVDGEAVVVKAGATLLDACDAAGRYVPRLCFLPGVTRDDAGGSPENACGLCVVLLGGENVVRACCTPAGADDRVATDGRVLREQRLERLADILARHPHICLACPDRDGCGRDECTYGHAREARCCDESGRCELGKVVAFVDADLSLQRRPIVVDRTFVDEGRIRRQPGLCIGCGRCVRLCATAPEAGRALRLEGVAVPKRSTLRESGCTFCGLCVTVCPSGAVTAPGEAGARWLAARREKHAPVARVMPPESARMAIPGDVERAPEGPGLLTLYDGAGRTLRISGLPALRRGLEEALSDPVTAGATHFRAEPDPLFTQRETEALALYVRAHGHLPEGDGLGDDLFDEGHADVF